MKHSSLIVGLLSSIALPSVIAAQSSNFSVDGSISVGNYWSDSGNNSIYKGSVDGSFQLANVGGGSVGIDLGLELFGTLESSAFDLNHTYYALTYEGGFGKVSVGLPRSAYDATGPSDRDSIAKSPILAEFTFLTRSIVEYALVIDTNLYGASYEGQSGTIAYRLSYHTPTETGSSADILAAGADYSFGSMTASAAIESVSSPSGDQQRYKLGLQGTAGAIEYGVSYGGGDSLAGPDATTISAFGNYAINDRISVGLDVLRLNTSSGSATAASIGAAYNVSDHFDVEANYTNLNDGGGALSFAGVAATYNF